MIANIEFIYFDVGGVLIYDFSGTNKWQEMLDNLRLSGDEKKIFLEQWRKYEPDICSGKKTTNDFVNYLSFNFNIHFPLNYSMLDDFISRFEKNYGLEYLLQNLKKRYSVGLLTNMYPGMLDLIRKKGILGELYWNSIIDSSKEGWSKPEERIYRIAEEKAGIRGGSILFIDNKSENLETAKKLGWQTILYEPENSYKSDKIIEQLLF